MNDTNHIEVLREIRRVYIDPETIAALDAAITALSARASAGEGGEWVMVPRDAITAAAAELSAQGCKDSASDLLQTLLAAAPQPQQAPSQECRCIDDYVCDRCNEQTSRAVAAAAYSTPPAHGDGEGEPVFHLRSYGDVSASDLAALTTRPTPEASELIANWRRQAEYSRGVALQKEREGKNHDWFDACADAFTICANNLAALALPAQGEG